MEKIIKSKYSLSEIKEAILILENLANSPEQLASISREDRIALMKATGIISRPNKHELKNRNKILNKVCKLATRKKNNNARESTGIRIARRAEIFTAPKQIDSVLNIKENIKLSSPRNCYICKDKFTELHFFYDCMCKKCGDLNYKKRFQSANLAGQVALITGSRLKIGYQATLMLLRAGARVIATTRFPVDSASRYSQEADFNDWGDRLHIFGLDLRHTPSVEVFTNFIKQNYPRLDILINNAAQTVRRPPGFYSHLLENENKNKNISDLNSDIQKLLKEYKICKDSLDSLCIANGMESKLPIAWSGHGPGIGIRQSAQLSQIPYGKEMITEAEKLFPQNKLDSDLQQVDLRKTNSWRLKMGEIESAEMLEVQLVNSVAPFILCNRLIPLMKLENTGQKHIVNVTAMEGKFFKFKKDSRHPHTNMAKAALNMMVHTSAEDLSKNGIFINAVDTGWVTDEDPFLLAKFKQEIHDFHPPLDIVDGAARVCDPIFDGILTGKHWCGKFLKDYFPIDW